MQARDTVRRVLATPPVSAALRALNSQPRLSEDRRSWLYHRITKKIPADPSVVFTHRIPGGEEIRAHLDGTIRRLYWTATYETDALPLFTAYARRCQTILDVGAAEGIYTLFAAAVNPTACIVAFEPGSAQQERLRANLAANPTLTGGRVQIATMALSDHEGTAEFHELPGGTSSLNPEFRTETRTRTVEVGRGDRVVLDLLPGRSVELIKVDTESTEPAVLRGLDETIRRDRPTIFCEVLRNRSEGELQQLVDDWDYRTYWLSGEGAVRRPRIEGDPTNRFANWLFLPDDQPLPEPAPIR